MYSPSVLILCICIQMYVLTVCIALDMSSVYISTRRLAASLSVAALCGHTTDSSTQFPVVGQLGSCQVLQGVHECIPISGICWVEVVDTFNISLLL